MTVRIIPRLDIKGGNLVKGINLEGLRILGDPEVYARHYYQQGADELLYLDAVASLYGRNSLTEFIQRTAASLFIPMTVGGGIRTLDDVRSVLRAGADKVAINTAAIESPGLLQQVSETFGVSTVVLSIVAKRHDDGRYTAYMNNGRDDSGRDVFEWLDEATDLGVGEVLVTALDRDGTGRGFDVELIKQVNDRVTNPVIASGGAGSARDVADVLSQTGVRAVSLASALHYPIARGNSGNRTSATGGEFRVIQETFNRRQVSGTDLTALRALLTSDGFSLRPYRTQAVVNA